jgi:molecular chaperone GrpE (heat shock protein)
MTEGLESPLPDAPVGPPDAASQPGSSTSADTAVAALDGAEQPGEPVGAESQRPSPIEIALARLADHSERYHQRAAHREDVIDRMHAELERLRRGERRSMLRPLLSEVCRLRDDVLRQAATLPEDFDARRASLLLRSYADSLEIALADNGVATYEPAPNDGFEPRWQRAVARTPSEDPTLVGRIASIRTNGYRDVDTNAPIAPAEVVIYVQARQPEPNGRAPGMEPPARTDSPPTPAGETSPVPTRGETL